MVYNFPQSEKLDIPFTTVFLISVFGFRLNWSSNGVSFIFECGFNLRLPKAFLTDSFCPNFSDRKVFTSFLIEPIFLSTSPVLVCNFGVPKSESMLYLPQVCLNLFPVNAVPWSVTIFSGIPYVEIFSSRKAMAIWELGREETVDTGHFENLSTHTSTYRFCFMPSKGR